MDSLSLYYDICKKYKSCRNSPVGNSIKYLCMDSQSWHLPANNSIKLENFKEIVECIFSEIMRSPCDLENSPFITETKKMVKSLKASRNETKKITLTDAHLIVLYVKERMENNTTYTNNGIELLFTGREDGANYLSRIEQNLSVIEQIIQSKSIEAKSQGSEEKKASGVPSLPSEGGTTVELSNSSPKDTQIIGEKAEIRNKNYGFNVQQWHDETTKIKNKLLEMQPTVSKLLQQMMSFSTEITENYVLQFARMQIRLFDLISDNYSHHNDMSARSGNKEYANAVSNYNTFLDTIVENLSTFGIEKISSKRGTGFDGNIHEVIENDSFSPKKSIVSERVRPGFKYNDIVIQKEKVRVEESSNENRN